MRKTRTLIIVLAALTAVIGVHCNNSSSPMQPQQLGPQLTAVPPSVTVGSGGTQLVSVSGGIPPYSIASAPSSIATAQLVNPDSVATTVKITGVTVASVSTAVTIRDSASAKTVVIPINVH